MSNYTVVGRQILRRMGPISTRFDGTLDHGTRKLAQQVVADIRKK